MATLLRRRFTRWDSEGMAQDSQISRRPCPSPPPQYDDSGVRTNTRHRRYRAALEDEYHGLVQRAFRTLPNYRPPQGYVPRPAQASSVTDKVYISTREYPWVNFIGQLLGPRGRSLADICAQSGAHIVIRGKGSVKEGRSRRPFSRRHHAAGETTDDPHEPLHCLINADTRDKVGRARALVHDVVERAATTPEHTNKRKRQQLRDLAVANGTFRDDEARGHNAGRLLTLHTDASTADSAPASIPAVEKTCQPNALDLAYAQFEAEMKGCTNS
ncbi:hypothetical protein PG994_008365 [Apiospora phragmitis]|uniref:Branchpoint-bridging protein n=1 Tax=Apiospora phragmitis TaxID=2905665 RepID=A0ABR1UVY5_9PEZI